MRVRFAEFTLDSEARRLVRDGDGDIHLSPKAFDLLTILVERRPNVLDKSVLHAEIWPRTFVVDANLTVLVAELRRALADNPRKPRFIRTLHAHGYAFCGRAVALPAATADDAGARCWLMVNGRALVLPEGRSIVGRDPDCDVWLDVSGVSRRHARIEVVADSDVVRVEDLGSKNGTFVDGVQVRGVVRVSNGSVVQIGLAELTVRIWRRGQAGETERIRRKPTTAPG